MDEDDEAKKKEAEEADEAKKDGDKKGKAPTDKNKQDKEKPAEASQIKHGNIKKNVDDLFRRDVEEANDTILKTPEFRSNDELKKYLQ